MPKESALMHGNEAVVLSLDDREFAARLDSLDTGAGFLIRSTHRLIWRVLDKRFAEFGITPEMWTYLRVIWKEEGLSQRQIAERLSLEGPTVGTALKIMEKRGLIVRKRNRNDGREWRVYLRPRARSLKRKLLPIAERTNAEAKAGISPEQIETLKNCLLQMRANLAGLAEELEGKAEKRRAV